MIPEQYLVTSKVDQLLLKWLKNQKKSGAVWMNGEKIAAIQKNGTEFNLIFKDARGFDNRLTLESFDILRFSKFRKDNWYRVEFIKMRSPSFPRFITQTECEYKYFLLLLESGLIKPLESHEETALDYGLL